MRYKYVGISTKKTYAEGTIADCLRKLHEDYPSFDYETEGLRKNKGGAVGQVLPEPLQRKVAR